MSFNPWTPPFLDFAVSIDDLGDEFVQNDAAIDAIGQRFRCSDLGEEDTTDPPVDADADYAYYGAALRLRCLAAPVVEHRSPVHGG